MATTRDLQSSCRVGFHLLQCVKPVKSVYGAADAPTILNPRVVAIGFSCPHSLGSCGWRRTVCSLKRLRFDSTIINLQIKIAACYKDNYEVCAPRNFDFHFHFSCREGNVCSVQHGAGRCRERYPPIEVVVNKAIVVRLPRKATKVAVTQPQIAEVVVVAPDQLLINGKGVGATSLVVWFEEKTKGRKQ